MEGLEQLLQGVLSDPEAMQKIMGLAQSLGSKNATPSEEDVPASQTSPVPDLSALKELSGIVEKAQIDSRQQALLNALSPYMSSQRIRKLQRAMQAARMAELAREMLGSQNGGAHV